MKTNLTKEQSQHLIDLGVPKEKASKLYWKEVTDYRGRPFEFDYDFREGITDKPFALQRVGLTSFEKQDIFTLTDLLEILPKEIVYQELRHQIRIEWDDEWYADYVEDGYSGVITAKSEELIDALYELCVWAIKNKYL